MAPDADRRHASASVHIQVKLTEALDHCDSLSPPRAAEDGQVQPDRLRTAVCCKVRNPCPGQAHSLPCSCHPQQLRGVNPSLCQKCSDSDDSLARMWGDGASAARHGLPLEADLTSPNWSAGICALWLRQHGACLGLQGLASPCKPLHSSSGRHVSPPARLSLTCLGWGGPEELCSLADACCEL